MGNCAPCNYAYNNRKAEAAEKEKERMENIRRQQEEANKGKTIDGVVCGKEITSITQVGDTVIVMYADCSYTTVNKSKVNLEAFIKEKLACVAEAIAKVDNRLQAVEVKQAELKAYDDTELKERVTALEVKPDKDTVYDDTAVRGLITALGQRIPDISGLATKIELTNGLNSKVDTADLITIENLEGTKDLFKAVKIK